MGKENTIGEKKQIDRVKLRGSIIMCLITVLLLSGATYAWFTVNNSARVNTLAIQVASDGSLYIAKAEADLANKTNEISYADVTGIVLNPCTTQNGKDMLKPNYVSNDTVGAINATTDKVSDSEKTSYYYETTYWLKVEESLAEGVSPHTYAITLAKNEAENTGSFVHGKDGNGADNHPEYATRVSFEVAGQPVCVYEPNSNGTMTGTEKTDYATNNSGITLDAAVDVHKQLLDGTFSGETGNVYYSGDSDALFTVTGNTAVPVTMRIWFEGTDHECMNQIRLTDIETQIKFVAHKQE